MPNISPAEICFGIWSTVDRAVDVALPSGFSQTGTWSSADEVVRVGVAEVRGHGVAAVLGQDRGRGAVDLGECLVPGRLDQLAVAPDQRSRQPVGVGVELLDPVGLGADEAVAEDVLGVAAHLDHLVPSVSISRPQVASQNGQVR